MKKLALPSEMLKASATRGSPEGSPKGKGTSKSKSNRKTERKLERNDSTETIEIKPDYYDLYVERVNIIENIAKTQTIFSPEYIAQMKAEPRPGEKLLGNRENIRTPWDFNLSCFKLYKPDTVRQLHECFELDWARMRLPRAIKEEEAAELKDYMKQKYKYFREVYKYQAGIDPQREIMCISMNTFGAFAQELPGFVDMKTIKLADIDLEIISTNAGGRADRLNPANQIIRY